MMEHSLGYRNVFHTMAVHGKEHNTVNTVDYRQYVTSRLYKLKTVHEEPVAFEADSDVELISESEDSKDSNMDSDTELDDELPDLNCSIPVVKTEKNEKIVSRECKVVLTRCVVPKVSVKRKRGVDEVVTPKLVKKVAKVAKVVTVADDGYNSADDFLPEIVHKPREPRRHRNFTTRQQNDSFGVRDPSADSPAYTRTKTTSHRKNVFALFDM
jgi:hypothetical protein